MTIKRTTYGDALNTYRYSKAYALGAGLEDVDRVRTIASEYARGDIAWSEVVCIMATVE